jgi:hypothetical protein
LSGVKKKPESYAGKMRNDSLVRDYGRNCWTKYVYQRLAEGKHMPGVFVIKQSEAIGAAIEEILLLNEASFIGEWEGQIQYLPL